MYVVPSLNTNCGWLAEPVRTNAYVGTGSNAYAGTGAMKFHTGYGNGARMPYRQNTAGRAANQCTTTTLPRVANGPGPARACGKAAPFETSSPKSAKQIVRRMRHPRAYCLRPCGTGRNYRPAAIGSSGIEAEQAPSFPDNPSSMRQSDSATVRQDNSSSPAIGSLVIPTHGGSRAEDRHKPRVSRNFVHQFPEKGGEMKKHASWFRAELDCSYTRARGMVAQG